jgi:hypothetical protein
MIQRSLATREVLNQSPPFEDIDLFALVCAIICRFSFPRPDGLRQINPTGKISLNPSGKSRLRVTPSCPQRKGRWPSSPNVGMGCGGRQGIVRAMGRQGGINSVSNPQDVQTSGAEAYGEIVWT